MPALSPPFPQAGFSETQKLAALELKARMLSGEKIPIEELKAFVLRSEKDLSANRAKEAKAEKKPDDVDFF
jgi:hypothetical protein